MLSIYEKATAAWNYIQPQIAGPIDTLVVLGSGLGIFAESLTDAVTIKYSDIPHLPQSTVVGHAGRFVVGKCGNSLIGVMAGRLHYYEGYSLEEVTLPIRIASIAGVRNLIITNAAGGLNPEFQAGDFMVINDHINLLGNNPLCGKNDERFGPRFPDMTTAYYPPFRDLVLQQAAQANVPMRQGVYVAISGPSYETPAEIRMLRTLGADAVGMSTVPEVIVARHMGMRVLGISFISNLAAGITSEALNHEEVLKLSAQNSTKFATVLQGVIPQLTKLP
jgi:purine-nucleoside phosphorylase